MMFFGPVEIGLLVFLATVPILRYLMGPPSFGRVVCWLLLGIVVDVALMYFWWER